MRPGSGSALLSLLVALAPGAPPAPPCKAQTPMVVVHVQPLFDFSGVGLRLFSDTARFLTALTRLTNEPLTVQCPVLDWAESCRIHGDWIVRRTGPLRGAHLKMIRWDSRLFERVVELVIWLDASDAQVAALKDSWNSTPAGYRREKIPGDSDYAIILFSHVGRALMVFGITRNPDPTLAGRWILSGYVYPLETLRDQSVPRQMGARFRNVWVIRHTP